MTRSKFRLDQALGVLASGVPAPSEAIRRCWLQNALGIAAQQRVVGGGAGDVELGLQLLAPLPDQRRRHQHQHALGHAAQQVLLQHHPGLDGLAEPDLVGQQHPAAELLQHLAHGLDLIPEGLDPAQMRQAQQLVETLRQTEMGEALAQLVPAAILLGPCASRRPRAGARSSSAANGMSMSIRGSPAGAAGTAAAAGGGRSAGRELAELLAEVLAEALGGARSTPERARLRAGGRSRRKMATSRAESHWLRAQPPGKAGIA